jgi:hypothetical protein
MGPSEECRHLDIRPKDIGHLTNVKILHLADAETVRT